MISNLRALPTTWKVLGVQQEASDGTSDVGATVQGEDANVTRQSAQGEAGSAGMGAPGGRKAMLLALPENT